ncbi:MAG: hypothetical protein ACRD1R_04060 [Acidobacteriota bacterium]
MRCAHLTPSCGQEALDLDVLVDLWPVNTDAIAYQLPLRAAQEWQVAAEGTTATERRPPGANTTLSKLQKAANVLGKRLVIELR